MPPASNGDITRFLTASRRRLALRLFIQQACRAAVWASVGILPLIFMVALIGRRPSPPGVLLLWGMTTAGITLVFYHAGRRALDDVLRGMDLSLDRGDLILSASEFFGSSDPFKCLAVAQAQRWLAENIDAIRCLWRWPREVRFAPLAAVLFAVALFIPPFIFGGSTVDPTPTPTAGISNSMNAGQPHPLPRSPEDKKSPEPDAVTLLPVRPPSPAHAPAVRSPSPLSNNLPQPSAATSITHPADGHATDAIADDDVAPGNASTDNGGDAVAAKAQHRRPRPAPTESMRESSARLDNPRDPTAASDPPDAAALAADSSSASSNLSNSQQSSSAANSNSPNASNSSAASPPQTGRPQTGRQPNAGATASQQPGSSSAASPSPANSGSGSQIPWQSPGASQQPGATSPSQNGSSPSGAQPGSSPGSSATSQGQSGTGSQSSNSSASGGSGGGGGRAGLGSAGAGATGTSTSIGKIVRVDPTPVSNDKAQSQEKITSFQTMTKPDGRTGATQAAEDYDPAELNRGELEMLSPQRRSVALRYLELLRLDVRPPTLPTPPSTAPPAAESQPSTESNP